jgi:hypothetical protein
MLQYSSKADIASRRFSADSYSYLGVIFNYNGNVCTARKKLLDQANKALYALYRKIRNLAIPIDLQLKLFDSLITPILVYSCEVWGFENKQGIEKMHLQYCKRNSYVSDHSK